MDVPAPDIAAVTFDIDFTLWNLSTTLVDALAACHAELQATVPAFDGNVDHLVTVREAVAEEWAPRRGSAPGWIESVRREAFRRILADAGVGADDVDRHVDRLSQQFTEHRFGNIELYPGVERALGELRERVALGVITNGNSSLAATSIAHYFDAIVAADEYGYRKPDVRLFDAACAKLGHAPSHVVHVGDSLTEDVAGAQAAGMRAVWFNPTGAPNRTSVHPDAEIAEFSELVALVERGLRARIR